MTDLFRLLDDHGRMAFRLAEAKKQNTGLQAEIQSLRARLVLAEQVAADAEDHVINCCDSQLEESLRAWQYATGMAPATADEAAESSWEMRQGK